MSSIPRYIPIMSCNFCGRNHANGDCCPDFYFHPQEEHMNYMGNVSWNDQYSNTYNHEWRNYSNFAQNNWNVPRQPYNQPSHEENANLEEILNKFILQISSYIEKAENQFEAYEAMFINREASIKNLEQ